MSGFSAWNWRMKSSASSRSTSPSLPGTGSARASGAEAGGCTGQLLIVVDETGRGDDTSRNDNVGSAAFNRPNRASAPPDRLIRNALFEVGAYVTYGTIVRRGQD